MNSPVLVAAPYVTNVWINSTKTDASSDPKCRTVSLKNSAKKDFKAADFVDLYNRKKANGKEEKSKKTSGSSCDMCDEIRPIKARCTNCGYNMCATCNKAHMKIKETRNHKTIDVSVMKQELSETLMRLQSEKRNVSDEVKSIDRMIVDINTQKVKQVADIKRFTDELKKEIDVHTNILIETIIDSNEAVIETCNIQRQVKVAQEKDIDNKMALVSDLQENIDNAGLNDEMTNINDSIRNDLAQMKGEMQSLAVESPVRVEKGKKWDTVFAPRVVVDPKMLKSAEEATRKANQKAVTAASKTCSTTEAAGKTRQQVVEAASKAMNTSQQADQTTRAAAAIPPVVRPRVQPSSENPVTPISNQQIRFTQLTSNRYKQEKCVNLNRGLRRMCQVNENICISDDNINITIYNKELKVMKTIKLNHTAVGITHIPGTDHVIAAQCVSLFIRGGLHIYNTAGTHVSQISDGNYIDVYWHNNKLYGFSFEDFEISVQIYKYDGRNWIKENHIIPQGYYSLHFPDKLCVYDNIMYISSWNDNCIYTYSVNPLSGQLLQTIGEPVSQSPGKLSCPIISSVDRDGVILVADWSNNKFQLYDTVSKAWTVLDLGVEIQDPLQMIVDENAHEFVGDDIK